MDTDKIAIIDDGDVVLTEPDNMQVEDKPIIGLTDGTLALPPTQEMEVVKTKNIVLKRKNPEKNQFGNVKIIKNESASITVRDVVPYSSETAVVSYENIKHPIQRKMEKNLKDAEKQARIVRGKIDLTKTNLPEEVRIKSEWSGVPTIDINTIKRMPWIDFNHILDNTDIDTREQVIFDFLQNNMPDDNDRYYICHDTSTILSV